MSTRPDAPPSAASTTVTTAPSSDNKMAPSKPEKPTFWGTISEAAHNARQRRERKPQPWLVRKLAVPLTFGIMGYTAYVFAGRFVRGLIRDGGVSRRLGVGLLVPWSVLYLWMIWAYLKVIITPPGNACDYVPKTPRPLFPPNSAQPAIRTDEDADDDDDDDFSDPGRAEALADIEAGRIGGPSYEQMSSQTHVDAAASTAPVSHAHPPVAPPAPAPLATADDRGRIPRGRTPSTFAALLPQIGGAPNARSSSPTEHTIAECVGLVSSSSTTTVHVPASSYYLARTAYLRDIGIGQCVGARNHKFFVNFNLATTFVAAMTFGSLLGGNLRHGGDFDPQEIVIIILAALFLLFTGSLFIAHVRMITVAQTTVETFTVQRLKEREDAHLTLDGWGILEFRAKRKIIAQYNADWGNPNTEGNLWWPGSPRKAWEDVMGRGWLGWILPIGRPLGDGLSYEPNPRYDADGIWRRRSEWPPELR
ncbi:Palmitoyltransferase [Mycena kentingensis (nom. inval.)]|nr:Palmitoyltransferase [Mycena kentingensis (nom. inval.)]